MGQSSPAGACKCVSSQVKHSYFLHQMFVKLHDVVRQLLESSPSWPPFKRMCCNSSLFLNTWLWWPPELQDSLHEAWLSGAPQGYSVSPGARCWVSSDEASASAGIFHLQDTLKGEGFASYSSKALTPLPSPYVQEPVSLSPC